MQQYLELLKTIRDTGTYKPAAREGMPGTTSVFGYQFRHDLSKGFPLLTTKKMFWKGVVIELLWFLRGDTNIKYLVDNGVNIWNEDAYNYYLKRAEKDWHLPQEYTYSFDDFICKIKNGEQHFVGPKSTDYLLGDCGKQYGWLWRKWESATDDCWGNYYPLGENNCGYVDQIAELIKGLEKNPTGRRHIITAWNPGTLDDMALNACHAMVQFNCRPLTWEEKVRWQMEKNLLNWTPVYDILHPDEVIPDVVGQKAIFDPNIGPQYKLDCQLYQRSADAVLGVPFNIASYALLTHMIAKMCNMIPGEFIHTFGDVHIYDNHIQAVEEQLSRTPTTLPSLEVFPCSKNFGSLPDHYEKYLTNRYTLDDFIQSMDYEDFKLIGYNPQSKIKAELSTGLKHENRSQPGL